MSLSEKEPVTLSSSGTIVSDVSSIVVILSHSAEITHVAGSNASSRNLSAPAKNLQNILKTNMLINLLKNVRHPTTSVSFLCWAAMNGDDSDSFPKMYVHATCFVLCYRMHYLIKVLMPCSCAFYADAYMHTHTHSICIIEQLYTYRNVYTIGAPGGGAAA
jgi:hypothetical protein